MSMPSPKVTFKEQMHVARETAILQATCRLLGTVSFDAMTMDDVAHEVGIAKASLYKHFSSKEELCSAAMGHMQERVYEYLLSKPAEEPALDKLRAMVRWLLELQLRKELPLLPSYTSTLRTVLMADAHYQQRMVMVGELVGAWIRQAQAEGSIDASLPEPVVRYTLYARTCDSAVCFLRESGDYTEAQIVDFVLRTSFEGLGPRKP